MDRLSAFTVELSRIGADAALISRRENIRYLSGYTGEGALLITSGANLLITDFRYIEQAEAQAPAFNVIRTGDGVKRENSVQTALSDINAKTLAVETDFITHDEYARLGDMLTGVELLPLNGYVETLRQIKDDTEIASIIRAAEISCRAFMNILPKLKAGMTEKSVQIMLDFEMLSLGADRPAFDTIACAGEHGSLPHATPTEREIQNGELLTLDFGAMVDGYCADMTRTVAIGKVSQKHHDMYDTVLEAQLLALDAITPGAICGEVDKLARDYIDARYPGAFGHSLGHGVGLFIHEQPRLYLTNTAELMPGHVVTVEPGIYIPGFGGCRIEDMAILTSDGYIDPVTAPKELIEL